MFVTIINDCRSQDDIARQETRIASLIPQTAISFFGVSADFSVNATLEAAGGLIDVLDAAEGRSGFVLVNVAPRGDVKQDGHNGTPFCYFKYKDTTVISTVRGMTLSLVKKLNLVDHYYLMNVDEVMDYAKTEQLISSETAEYTKITQFRSFDFVPRVAAWLHQGIDIPAEQIGFDSIEDISQCVWYVDDFGNCKTTLTKTNIPVDFGEKLNTNLGTFTFYRRLKDLPKGETGMYLGSSGIESTRFIELATQQKTGSAASTLGIKVGQEIIIQ